MTRHRFQLLAPVLALLVAACDDPAGVGDEGYVDVVLADAPIAYWRFEETSGATAQDASGAGRHGAYVVVPQLGREVAPRLGAAIHLTSSNAGDGVRLEHAPWMNLTGGTFELWAKPDRVTYPEAILMLDKGDAWQLNVSANGRPAFAFPGGSRAQSGTQLVMGSVYHVVGTYDAQSMRLYLNGELQAQFATGGAPFRSSTDALHIGRGQTAGRFDFEGALDEVAIYDKVLTAERIRAHYRAGR
jgi:hypothetical protein